MSAIATPLPEISLSAIGPQAVLAMTGIANGWNWAACRPTAFDYDSERAVIRSRGAIGV